MENEYTPSFNGQVGQAQAGMRLDRALAAITPDTLTRNRLKNMVEAGAVMIDGRSERNPGLKVRPGQKIEIQFQLARETELAAENIPLDIIHEDESLIVLNKPAGLVVHPAPGNTSGTLVNALMYHCGEDFKGIGGEVRPGIVHRLDKDTSGLMVVAKDEQSLNHLSAQFKERTIERFYLALCWGWPQPPKGEIEGFIGRHRKNRKKMALYESELYNARFSLTHYETLERYGYEAAALVRCKLATGRTHQIRVHFAEIGRSIIGDPLYGRATSSRLSKIAETDRQIISAFNRQALHAQVLGFKHPRSGETLSFSVDPPSDFDKIKAILKTIDIF